MASYCEWLVCEMIFFARIARDSLDVSQRLPGQPMGIDLAWGSLYRMLN